MHVRDVPLLQITSIKLDGCSLSFFHRVSAHVLVELDLQDVSATWEHATRKHSEQAKPGGMHEDEEFSPYDSDQISYRKLLSCP